MGEVGRGSFRPTRQPPPTIFGGTTLASIVPTVNVLTYHNEDVDFSLTITDTESGEPIDMTGYTLAIDFRVTADAVSALLELTSPSNGIIIVDAQAGIINIRIPVDPTSKILPFVIDTVYVWDCLLISSGPSRDVIFNGTLKALQGVST